MTEWYITAGVFLIAGLVKGIVGFGLPTVCLAAFTLLIGLTDAMVLLLVPSFVTNVMQTLAGGRLPELVGRLKLFLMAAVVLIFPGALILGAAPPAMLTALLGLVLMAYAAATLAGFRPSGDWGRPMPSLLAGAANGLLTGMTGSFVVPGVMYLQTLGLPRDRLVQAMGVLFTVSTLALAVALGHGGHLSAGPGWLSLAGVPPALAGMWAGQRLRRRLAEDLFRRVFLLSLMVLGAAIALRAMLI